MYTVRVREQFKDLECNGIIRKVGEVYDLSSEERLFTLMGNNKRKCKFVELIKATKPKDLKREGNKVVIYQDYLYYIGGIETFLFNLVKNYKDRNITVMCRQIETPQIVNLSKYCDVEIFNNQKFSCDVLILGNYNCDYMLHCVKAKKIYQMIHADWTGLKRIPQWKDFKWEKNSKIDEVICVSDSAAKGLKESMGYDSKVIYNILDDNCEEEDGKVFITLSRATPEKGIKRIIKMAKEFKKAGKHFVWFLCCSLEQVKDSSTVSEIKSIPEFVIVPPSVYNKMLINGCDYLVQLSDTESFCYSAFEALQRGVPVILTEFPEAYNIVDDGENGFILKFDLSNLDVDKIFDRKPTNNYYIDRCNKDDWEKVFKGEF